MPTDLPDRSYVIISRRYFTTVATSSGDWGLDKMIKSNIPGTNN